eukprot:scaffold52959_cov59-Phaeocystis_antarctica.AAC.10
MQSSCGSARTRCYTCAELWTSLATRPVTTPRAGQPSSACTSYSLTSSTRSVRTCSAAQHVVHSSLPHTKDTVLLARLHPLVEGCGLL